MIHRQAAGIALALIAGMAALSVWAAGKVPEGARIPIHFGFNGAADRWAGAPMALAGIPVVALATLGLLVLLPRFDPRLVRSSYAYGVVLVAITAVLTIVHGLIVAGALGQVIDPRKSIVISVGALFLVLGNVLGKVRQNRFFGVRTPWTLSDERVWDQTHRFAGWLFVACGFILIALGVALPASPVLMAAMGLLIAGAATASCVKSYLLARERTRTD